MKNIIVLKWLTEIVNYFFDAWGKIVVKGESISYNNTSLTYLDIANINPFRYRGYYYDAESSFYYLNSRYYDPEIGRFINADRLEYLDPDNLNGLNLYAYCLNNPTNRLDYFGKKSSVFDSFLKFVKKSRAIPYFSSNDRHTYTYSLIIDEMLANLFTDRYVSISYQPMPSGRFYTYSNFDYGNYSHGGGVGINLYDAVSFEIGYTGGTFWDLGIASSTSIGSLSFGTSIGTSGIAFSIGLTNEDNITVSLGGTVGWGTIVLATLVALIPGGKLISGFMMLLDWII